ncbi:hypothetical protein A9995_15330 [Erythrobacter sp. QSSC1-22B]|uniref:MucR family transcriptional regulator n=1 Tax=Erythrobacter sp. QSSC1-22B TaxID=1860125 RepID=UPI000805D219|nr:MucR family transcriptional regulator [Erythrobacter sp. QSSC1-22B]OBX17664.1 hypothetical protein A9995_15330 [Erythrobacter sp. QSSC1-22B]
MSEHADLIELTSRIVEAHVQGTAMASNDIPELIRETYAALAGLGQSEAEPVEAKPEPAVSIRKSRADRAHLISLIDGKKYKTLKRHLANHGYTPERYRETFDLPADYPMTAPAYSERRAAMAKEFGLGRKAGQGSGSAKKSSG